jgi:hypothetical protein
MKIGRKMKLKEEMEEFWKASRNLLQRECDKEERLDLKFVLNLLTWNYINEEDRSLIFVGSSTRAYIMFGGKLNVGASFQEVAMIRSLAESFKLETKMAIEWCLLQRGYEICTKVE